MSEQFTKLVDRVRDDLANAIDENGYDLFGTMDDQEIAADMVQCTTGYDEVDEEDHYRAIAIIRAERTKETQ